PGRQALAGRAPRATPAPEHARPRSPERDEVGSSRRAGALRPDHDGRRLRRSRRHRPDVRPGARRGRRSRRLALYARRAAGSRTAGLSLHWLGGLPIHDATSNYRLYSKRLLNQVTIESQGGFEFGLELTVKAYRLGLRIAEVPTTWRDRTAGQSRFRLWQWLP